MHTLLILVMCFAKFSSVVISSPSVVLAGVARVHSVALVLDASPAATPRNETAASALGVKIAKRLAMPMPRKITINAGAMRASRITVRVLRADPRKGRDAGRPSTFAISPPSSSSETVGVAITQTDSVGRDMKSDSPNTREDPKNLHREDDASRGSVKTA